MSTTSPRSFGVAVGYVRLALLSIGVGATALGLGYAPTRALAGWRGVEAMVGGVGIALMAALLGLVPTVVALRRGPHQRAGGLLVGMLLRFLLTLGLLLLALWSGSLHKIALALWVVMGYLALLGADTVGVVWLSGRAARSAS